MYILLAILNLTGWICAFAINHYWCKVAIKDTEEWAEFAEKINNDWGEYCKSLIEQMGANNE